ncbi:hypothetical protein M0R45_008632 [Rubus argutus]|uniref:Uncharacterized protein n=1 Tax=Rubus argutus TaxID=59490 RepID=A0AAW1Y4A1_RUBAR
MGLSQHRCFSLGSTKQSSAVSFAVNHYQRRSTVSRAMPRSPCSISRRREFVAAEPPPIDAIVDPHNTQAPAPPVMPISPQTRAPSRPTQAQAAPTHLQPVHLLCLARAQGLAALPRRALLP